MSTVLPTVTIPRTEDSGTGASPLTVPGKARRAPHHGPSPRPERARLATGSWPLLSILAAQGAFAFHLARANTAFSDEALYLWAGHLEWAHWLHGEPLPAFPAYFSGAPVIYPPLGALADSVAGLEGARLLSLVFILAATALLYAATARLCGRKAGLAAAALWAFLGPTLHLSAFATYDALSLMLVALSVWCVIRANGHRDAAGWLFAAAIALTLANATAYSSAIFDPLVIAVALLACPLRPKVAGMRATALGAYVASLVVLAATAGGGLYFAGIAQTVLSRVAGNVPAPEVLIEAWRWTQPVVILAAAGVLFAVATERTRRKTALLAVLACAALLVPVEQARIRTGTSLDKHTDFGAWFAAMTAGYAVAKIVDLARKGRWQRWAAMGAVTVTFAATAQAGFTQAETMFASWPDATPFVTVFGPLLARTHGPVLVETSPVAEYYLPQGREWQRWSNTFAIMFLSGHGEGPGVGQEFGMKVYAPLLASGYWSLIALNYGSASWGLDHQMAAVLNHSPLYRRAGTIPYSTDGNHGFYEVWEKVIP